MLTISTAVARLSSQQQSESQSTEQTEICSLLTRVMENNNGVLTTVLQMQKILENLPPQVERQQPVLFEDAHGRRSPFHVEFINSFAAFQAVLEARFDGMPGIKRVKNFQYAMQDVTSKRVLDLTRPWESIFRPGRSVNMSMIFKDNHASSSLCPACRTENTVASACVSEDIQWYEVLVLLFTHFRVTYFPA